LLEELHSTDAVGAVMDFFSEHVKSPEDDLLLARKIASSLNLILCFKPEVEIDASTREQIRSFATALIVLATDQIERAAPFYFCVRLVTRVLFAFSTLFRPSQSIGRPQFQQLDGRFESTS
jgi:hypothetical protein